VNANIRAVTGSGDTGSHVARVAADAVAGDIRAAGYAAGWAEGRRQAAEEIAEGLRIRLQAAQDAADAAAYGEDDGQAYHDAGEAWALKKAIRFVEEVGRGA